MSDVAPVQHHAFFSEANRRRFPVWVHVPDGPGPFPLLFLLHGVIDADGSGWWRLAHAHRVCDEVGVPCVIVMPPDTGVELGSGWCDWADGTTRAETFVLRELLPWAEKTFPVDDRRWITGLSMGGYGALTLALRNAGVFASATSTSGFVDPHRLFTFVPDAGTRMWHDASEHDALCLLDQVPAEGRPRLALDCGVDDHLIAENRRVHAALEQRGIPHGYAEHAGGHEWDYWAAHLGDHLRFHAGEGGPLLTGTG